MANNSQFAMAVHILTMLATADDAKVKSDCIASSVNTNPVVIRRLLGILAQAKLVSSQTGASGGTQLSRPPGDITLSEIYKAVPCGEVFALRSKSPDQNCPVGKNIETLLCVLQKEIDTIVDKKLGQYTLLNLKEMIDMSSTR